MDDKKGEVFKKDSSIPSVVGSLIHEEPSEVPEPNADCSEKQNVTTDTDFGSTIDASFAQDKQDATASIDENFSLRLESSDEDTFNDAIDIEGGAPEGLKIDVKSAISNKSDTLFSDIESSDDSIVYEPKSNSAVSPVKEWQSRRKGSPATTIPASICEEKKVVESEFDPVESDEEFFEDLPLPEKTEQISQEAKSDKTMQEEEERSSTPLIDEENDKSTELDLLVEGVEAIKASMSNESSQELAYSPSNIFQSMDLVVESSVDIPQQIIQDSTDPSNTIATSQDLADDKSAEDNYEESSIIGPMLIPDVMEETIILSSSSLLLGEKEERPTSKQDSLETVMVLSDSSKQAAETVFDSLQDSSSIPTPDEKSEEKLVEALPSVELESSENSNNVAMSPTILKDDPKTIEIDKEIPEEINFESLESSKIIQELAQEDETISMSPMLVEEEMTEESNLEVDDKMEENLLKSEVNDSLAPEEEKLEEEEPMEIDETILEVSGVSDLEIIEDDTTVEKTDKQCLHQNESQKSVEKEPQLKIVEENKDVENNSDTDKQMINKPIDKSTELAEIDDKLDELEQSQKELSKPAEIAAIEKREKPIKQTENLNKAEDSNEEAEPSDAIEELSFIETEETKTDDKLVDSPKVSADDEMKGVESTEKENPDDVIKKIDEVAELLVKPDNVVKSQKEVPDEDRNVSKINPSTLDDHTATNKAVIDCNETPLENIEKTPEKCLEDQMDDGTETRANMQDTDVDGTSIKFIEKASEPKTNEKVAESNENKESPKEIEEPAEKSEASVADATETIEESPQKQVETAEESNKQLSDSTEKHQTSEKILASVEESSETSKKEESPQENALETSETKQQNPEKEDSLIETVELVDESDVRVRDSVETSESLDIIEKTSEESNKQEEDTKESPHPIVEPADPGTDSLSQATDSIQKLASLKETAVFQKAGSIEKQESLKEAPLSQETGTIEKQTSLKETALSQEADSIEKQETLKEIVLSQEIDSIEKQESLKETTVTDPIEKQTARKETAVSQETANSKKSEEIETTKSPEVLSSNKETGETPAKVATEGVVEKVEVEVATSIESTKSNEINDSSQHAIIPPAKVDPNIIEIDDDDDDLAEEKKVKDSSKKDEKASSSSTSEKEELQENKIDDVVKVSQNIEAKEPVTPMDIDEEITTQKPTQKPTVEEKTTNRDAKTDQESSAKDGNTTMKGIPVQALDDDDEPLLMIDTSHKEDNDTESNFMDTETATSAPTTDSSSDGSLEVFYDKECVNYECKRATKNFYRAAVFAMNYFKVSKKRTKTQFVCEDCYDRALASYEELCKTLKMKQPLLHGTTFKCQEFVEIIDSSDEDESDTGGDKVKVSDENALPKESIEMLEAELEGAIAKVMHNVDIQKQLSWTKQILQQRLTNLQEDSDFVSEQLRALQRKADHMHNSLYQCPKIKLRQLTPLDLNSGRMYNPESDNSTSIPLPGDIIRNPICVNEQYYAVKTKAIASWVPCKVIEEVEGYQAGYNSTKTYKIKFTKLAKYPMFKTVYAKHMAYYDPPNVRLPIGSRVIAYFDATSLSRGKEKMLIPSAFYPGIIAEPLKQSNKFRYLVFYDDGYFQYVNHKDVRLVCQASDNVWEDVHHQSREFIHNYLTQYAVNRPMVQTQKGQSMLVDYNGKWIYARVIDVDCSLVQMLFEGQSRSEWIYRGSTRLGPVYKESNNLSQKNTLNATRRRTEPFIRYINGDDSSSSQQVQETETPQTKAGNSEIRSVAKKSVSRVDTSNNNSTTNSAAQPVPTVRHLNNSTIFVDDDNKPKGKVVYYTARKNLPPRNYVPHICNPSCPFNITHNLSFYSPLAKPLLSGWERQVFRQKSKKFIIYRGPCGKRMRNIEELHRYLRVTDNELNVDSFDFSPDTNCLAEYVLEKCLVNKKDISCGKEKMPIPCVNYYDETMPPACEYSAVRIPTEGVPLNLSEEFLCGCDCEDDCSDKTKCACWQLTYAGAKYGMPTVPTEMVGYQYKRLYEHVPTGIYECNSRCKCKASCVNRVVQQPLQSKLQVFKTSNRGWGLRCINDVPRGSFICVYAGQMLTEQVANEGGLDAGDEYFAELDYIEVAEQIKEGYESDVQEPEEDEDLYNPEREDDDIDFRAPGESFKDKEFNTRLRARKGNKNSTDGEFDSQERQVISFEPNKNMDTSNEPNEKPTIRKLFGKDESCYVMDAKVRGNLGRYFNHSCSPNLFVQNVFVDTHDLRFPWVAFFASTHIRAGTELTWNYNYEVGVVPGKVLYCQCGAPNCRQRLL